MTANKNSKKKIRARMAKTGESYSTALAATRGQLGRDNSPPWTGISAVQYIQVPPAEMIEFVRTHDSKVAVALRGRGQAEICVVTERGVGVYARQVVVDWLQTVPTTGSPLGSIEVGPPDGQRHVFYIKDGYGLLLRFVSQDGEWIRAKISLNDVMEGLGFDRTTGAPKSEPTAAPNPILSQSPTPKREYRAGLRQSDSDGLGRTEPERTLMERMADPLGHIRREQEKQRTLMERMADPLGHMRRMEEEGRKIMERADPLGHMRRMEEEGRKLMKQADSASLLEDGKE